MDETEEPRKSGGSATTSSRRTTTPQSASRSSNQPYNFDFYMRFTKPLIVELPNPNDKTLASAWVKKLKEDSSPEELRTEYLKLLLFVLHRRKLGGPFVHQPGKDQLDKLPEKIKVIDVARDILHNEHEEQEKRIREKQRGAGDFPPYSFEVSGDMLQFAATQDIPKFGKHLYFAVSTEPLSAWANIKRNMVPRVPSLAQSNISIMATKSKPLMEAERSALKSPKSKTPPSSPLAPLARKDGTTPSRRPIVWGSNLIEVGDPREKSPKDDQKLSISAIGSPSKPKFLDLELPSSPVRPTRVSDADISRTSSPSFLYQSMSPKASTPITPSRRSGFISNPQADSVYQNIMDTSMPHDLLGSPSSPKTPVQPSPPPRFQSPYQYDDLMNTSMPNFDEFLGSPKKTPSRSPKSPTTPKTSSAMAQVRHISMRSRDHEARKIIDEANKLLKEQEMRVNESSSIQKSPTTAQGRTPIRTSFRASTKGSPPPPRILSPQKDDPSPRNTPDLRYQHRRSPKTSSGLSMTPGTTKRDSSTLGSIPTRTTYTPTIPPDSDEMVDLFPNIHGGDDDDNFLFGDYSDIDLNEVNFLDENLYTDLEEQVKKIRTKYGTRADDIPVSVGSSATGPLSPMTPRRQNKYGEDVPLFADEDIPDLLDISLSPASLRRLENQRHGLPSLVSDRRSPVLPTSSPKSNFFTAASQTPRIPKNQKTPDTDKDKDKTPPCKKQTTPESTSKSEEESQKYSAMYKSLIAPDSPRKTPKEKTPCSNIPKSPSTPPPSKYSMAWDTPPRLKIQREEEAPQSPESPSFTFGLGEGLLDNNLFQETFPDMLPPDTPPKAPEPMSYDQYINPFKQEEDKELENLIEEEEPLGAKLEAHEWHPYKPRQFSIKVGARAKNVILPRKSAPPSVAPISEEDEFYYLNATPPQSPAKIPKVDFAEPYMLPSGAPQRFDNRAKTPPKTPPQASPRTPQRTPTKTPLRTPEGTPKTDRLVDAETNTILEELEEHFAPNIEDPRQQALLSHVSGLLKTVECQAEIPDLTPKSSPRRGSPSRQYRSPSYKSPKEQTDSLLLKTPPKRVSMISQTSPGPYQGDDNWLEQGSPPGNFDDIDRFDAMSPSPRAFGRQGFRTPPVTPDLHNISPPQFDDVDEIDAAPKPTTRFVYPSPKAKRRSSLEFDKSGEDINLLNESMPFSDSDSDSETPRRIVQTIDTCQRDARSQTTRRTTRKLNQSWPRTKSAQTDKNKLNRSVGTDPYIFSTKPETRSELTNTEEVKTERSKSGATRETKTQIQKSTVFGDAQPDDNEEQTENKQEILYELLEVQTPTSAEARAAGSPSVVTKQIKKKIQFDQSPSSQQQPKTPNISTPQRQTQSQPQLKERSWRQSPRTPPPDDMMGVEGYVDYTPRQYLIDDSFSGHGLQTPMKLPVVFPGWSTPEHLKIQSSPQLSPPKFPWVIPVRYPGALEAEPLPSNYYNDDSFGTLPISPSRSSTGTRRPIHKTHVTKIYRAADGTTTTTTVETLEQTSPPPNLDDDFSSDHGASPMSQQRPSPVSQQRLSPILPQRQSPVQQQQQQRSSPIERQPMNEPYASTSEVPMIAPRKQKTPKSPQRSYNFSPRTPPRPPAVYPANDIWKTPINFNQEIDFSPPQLYEDKSFNQESFSNDQPPSPNGNQFDDVVYHPPPQTPPRGDYGRIQSPSQYKTPDFKKTTFIHEERPLYERVEQIVEGVIYEPKDSPPPNVSPPRFYTLDSPPRPDYFDVIDIGNRQGIEDEPCMQNLYQSPTSSDHEPEESSSPCSPRTPQLLQGNDWDLWDTPPSGRAPSPPMPDLPGQNVDYEPIDFDNDFMDLNQSSYMFNESVDTSLGGACEQAGAQFDMNPQAYNDQFNQNQEEVPELPEERNYDYRPTVAFADEPPRAHEDERTTKTIVTEEVYYDDGTCEPNEEMYPNEQRYDLQWNSPPRESLPRELPRYEPYQPPSLYPEASPVTPPNFNDDSFEPGLYNEEPMMYRSPESENTYGNECYDNIDNEYVDLYQSP